MFIDVSRKSLKEGAIPTLNAPQKSFPTSTTSARSSNSIQKREAAQFQNESFNQQIPRFAKMNRVSIIAITFESF